MRWDALFTDLEAQAEALAVAERSGEVDERARMRVAALGLLDRLRPAVGTSVRLHCAGELTLHGQLRRVGPDWLLLDEHSGREAVVSLAAIAGVGGLSRLSAVPDSRVSVESRLGLRHVLSGVARDRSAVRIRRVDGSSLDATLDRVGADFVEAALHAPGETRRRTDVREVLLVPFTAVSAVQRAGELR